MSETIIFVPVGTSLITRRGDSIDQYEDQVSNILETITANRENARAEFSKRPHGKDLSAAEISSLYKLCSEIPALVENRVRLVLLHSRDEGKACARGIRDLMINPDYFCHPIDWTIKLVELKDLDPRDSTCFPLAMDDLTRVVLKEIRDFQGKIYINLSGGYKAIGPYLTLLAMVLGSHVKIFYLFEESTGLIWLPSYPMAFDLLEWRDWRGLLRPFTANIGLSDDQKKGFRSALEGTRIADLIESKAPYGLNAIGRTMNEFYSGYSGRRLTEFGLGHTLLSLLKEKEPDWARYLEEKCIPRWRHLSVGDRIPETAEHGRGHVQRLLELTHQLIVAARLQLSRDQLFTLICSIWLHDLGHSGDCFRFEGEEGIIQRKDFPASEEPEFVLENPELVRQYHHLLTCEILKGHRDFLFPVPDTGFPGLNRDHLPIRSVEFACLYHRGMMPVGKAGPYDDKVHVSKGLEEIDATNGAIEGFPLVAALLRFLDGTENQEERTGSEEYYRVTKWVLERQIESMSACLAANSCDTQLKARICFKEIQSGHYEKHRWVRTAFFVPAGDSPTWAKCYGREQDADSEMKPVVALYLIANADADGFDENRFNKDITNAVIKEFEYVSLLLPFRLVLFRVLESEATTTRLLQYWSGVEFEQWPHVAAPPSATGDL